MLQALSNIMLVNTVLQNVTGAYVIIVLVYRRLLTTSLGGKADA